MDMMIDAYWEKTAYRYLACYRHHIIRQIIKPIIYKVEGVSVFGTPDFCYACDREVLQIG